MIAPGLMNPLKRRVLLTGAAALPLAALRARPVQAADFSYKFATNLPVTHPMNVRIAAAIERIKTATNGQLAIELFPNSQLGSDPDMLSQVRSGAIQFFTLSGLILSTLVPLAAINGVGFAFKDTEQVFAAMDGKLGALVRAEIAKRGLMAFPHIFDSGYRQITSSVKPIRAPEDLKAMKIRVPPSALWTSMFTAFGASPTTISFNETYSALQTKIADGQENPLSVVDTAKLYEVQSYCSMTNHMWDGFWLLTNKRAFDQLPQGMQDVAAREFDQAVREARVDVAKLNADLRAQLSARGLKFNDTDPAAFRDMLRRAGFYSDWKRRFGDDAWATLEGVVGPLS
jgi:tripartite ATP-independent transporter DctP family solute receptor